MGSEDTHDCCGKARIGSTNGGPLQECARPEKKRILDEFLESTGLHRKHATRFLNDILRGERPRQEPRGRIRRYGPAVQAALIAAWRTVNYVCGKRLVPFLPELIPTMERHGHLSFFVR